MGAGAANTYMRLARKLQKAIEKQFGVKLLFNTAQWYSDTKQDIVCMYTVKRTEKSEKTGKYVNTELFTTYSQIQLVLWLRDYWYTLNGWEVPTDNAVWEAKKKEWEVKKKDG